MKFNEIPKFVVNLERRPDRLEEVKKEMEYIGWDYEIFKAVDTGTHEGITMSTLQIIDIAKEKGYPRVMIIEDDIRFMPYAKDFLEKIEEQCKGLEFGIFNLSPTLDRPLNKSEKYDLLLDMTNLPPKKDYQRDIYAANLIIYDESIYDVLYDIKVIVLSYPLLPNVKDFQILVMLNIAISICKHTIGINIVLAKFQANGLMS